MNEKEFEVWLNDGLAESVASAEAAASAPAAVPPPAPAPKSLSNMGIGRGGVIRDPKTVRRSELRNPVANPKAPKLGKSVPPTTPESDLRSENPALAIPSMMPSMDMDYRDKPAPSSNGAPTPEPLSYGTTLAELLNRAKERGGKYHVGNRNFILSIELTQRPPSL
jgi:hypothetical protein